MLPIITTQNKSRLKGANEIQDFIKPTFAYCRRVFPSYPPVRCEFHVDLFPHYARIFVDMHIEVNNFIILTSAQRVY